jgi:hypothetical protein
MTYEERVQAFWKSVEGKSYTGYELAVGLALIELWRRRGCPKTCAISNVEVAKIIGSNEKTVRRACKKLVDNCIFWRWNEKRTAAPIYCFNKADFPENWHPKKEERLTTIKIETMAEKRKNTNGTFFSDKELQEAERAKAVLKPMEPPTLQRCLEEFSKQGGSEEDARAFYLYYSTQGWRKANGNKIYGYLEDIVTSWLLNKKGYERTTNNRQCGKLASQEDALRAELLTRYGQI